ncbi:hypothetical protein L0152_16090, partial [bacterium]|nr:hypothetical protein [bacterium]
ISEIRNQLRREGKLSEDEIRFICRQISHRELDSGQAASSSGISRGLYLYWFFSIFWLITLIAVIVLNGTNWIRLNEGMYWLFVSGSAILLFKNSYGIFRNWKN